MRPNNVCKFHVPNVISTIHTILHGYWYQLPTRAHFQNWSNTLLSSAPNLELYPSIFLHKQIFANCTITVLILFSYFIVFLPILLGMYSYTFHSQPFSGSSIEVYCYTFLLLPIFRTGLIHFCHPSPFWNCILPLFYTSPFLELYYYTYHYIFLFHSFPADTFRNVLLHFLSPTFFLPVSQNCNVTLF